MAIETEPLIKNKVIQIQQIEYPPVSSYVFLCVLINFQTLGFGTTLAYTGPTIDEIASDLSLCGDDDEALCEKVALVAAIFAIGAVGGAILAGPLVNHSSLGRRPVYLMNLVLFIGGYTLIGLSQSYTEIILGRLITGFAGGISGVVIPMYVGEISPPQYRGILGSFFNIGIAGGILGVDALSFFGLGWRKLAYLYGTIPQVIVLLFFWNEKFFPESPEHLISIASSNEDENYDTLPSKSNIMNIALVFESLHRFSSDTAQTQAKALCKKRQTRNSTQQEERGETSGFIIRYGYALMLAVGVPSGFALSAVNCVCAYTSTIFALAGVNPGVGNVYFASTQVVVAILGSLFLTERYGRRLLLLISAAGCMLGHLIVVAAFSMSVPVLAVVGAMVFIGSVAIGLGALSFVYASEILPNAVRPLGMTLAGVSFWSISFVLNYEFTDMISDIGKEGSFLVFAGLSAGVFIFIWTCLIETRGRSLEEIETLVMKK